MNKNYAPAYFFTRLLLLSVSGFFTLNVFANSTETVWSSNDQMFSRSDKPLIDARTKRGFTLDVSALRDYLKGAPHEDGISPRNSGFLVAMPGPDGKLVSFRVVESPIMEPGLAAKFPEIKTYMGEGKHDRSWTVRFDITPKGFHAMVFTFEGTYFIDPAFFNNVNDYIVYKKSDFIVPELKLALEHACKNHDDIPHDPSAKIMGVNGPNGSVRRSYRLAVAATGEYTAFHSAPNSPNKPAALAAIVTTFNRVNSVYERDFCVRLNLVANNDLIIYTNANTDPYANNNAGTAINQNQTNITSVIGAANYDVGHLCSTGAGGLAGLGVVCNNSNKARGVTGLPQPIGDPYDIDYVSHEVGHQFGATHTFNGSSGSCSGNRSAITAYEPGSGSTIMAYAGICSPQNLQPLSDAHFHNASYTQVVNFITSGGGASCAITNSTGNTPPTVSAGGNYTIPRNTPFLLTGTASDVDNDTLTYNWEEYDLGPQGAPNQANVDAPIFRSFPSVSGPSRTFPKLSDLLANTTTIGEILPNIGRTMKFRLTVRDNKAGNGGVNDSEATITVSGSAGPFQVTAPNTAVTWQVFSTQNVTWNRASTHLAPISCQNVDILLSVDGGITYPHVLASNTLNDGAEQVVIPNYPSTQCRIKVQAVGNIFFDISNVNFTIPVATIPDYSISSLSGPQNVCKLDTAPYLVNLGSLLGFTSPVNLSVTGLPTGVTSFFSSATVNPPDTATVFIVPGASSTDGTYSFNVVANGSTGTKTIQLQVKIVSGVPTAVTLTAPANNATGLSTKPTFSWSAATNFDYYIVQIASDSLFNTIVETGIATTNAYLTQNLLIGNQSYWWRVRSVNACGQTAFTTQRKFTTENVVCAVFSGTDSVVIPTTANAIIASTIYVPVGGTIRDVNVVNVRGLHSYIQDIEISLLSPGGTTVKLLPRICGNEDNFYINFDDDAANNSYPCPPTDSLTYKPNQPLSTLNGQYACGLWTLIITDFEDQDGGLLQGWGLEICTDACVTSQNVNITTQPQSLTRCTGQSFTATVAANSPSDMTFQWRRDGVAISGANGLTYQITNLAISDAATYDCVISNCCGSVVTNPAILTMFETPPKPTITQSNDTLYSSAPAGNQWFRGGIVIFGGTNQWYVPTVTQTYTVQVTIGSCVSPLSDPFSFTLTGLGPEGYLESSILIYPNPAEDMLNIFLPDGFNGNWSIELFDMVGKQVRTEERQSNALVNQLNLDEVASGTYLIRISSDSFSLTRKLEINR